MRKFLLIVVTFLLGIVLYPVWAQDYQARMTNFKQTSEYEFPYDVQIRNLRSDPAGAGAWAYNSSQFQIDINTDMLNGGTFNSLYLTLDNSVSDLPVNQQLPNEDFFYSIPNTALATGSPSTGTGSALLLLNHDEWRTIGRFVVKLRNAADNGFLNFGDVDPEFAFRLGQTIVFRVDYYMDGGIARRLADANAIVLQKTAEDLIIDTPDRQLAGYWFTGDGNWSDVTKWNQTLKAATPAYVQAVPGPNANAIINGNSTIQGGDAISLLPDVNGNGGELTVLTGEEPLYTLTVAEAGDYPGEITFRVRISPLGDWLLGSPTTYVSSGSSIQVPAGVEYRVYSRDNSGGDLAFNGWSSPSPGVVFTNPLGSYPEYNNRFVMPANNVIINSTWVEAKKSSTINAFNQEFHTDINNPPYFKETFDFEVDYIKNGSRNELFSSLTLAPLASLTVDKLFNDHEEGAAAIIVKSSSTGTGSLIHNSNDVPATIERYISGPGYHLVSVPFTQAANPVSGWFLWSYLYEFVPGTGWQPLGAPTSTPLNVDQGYMVYKYPGPEEWSADTTYSMEGPMNNGLFTVAVSGVAGNHNLVPNPYPSAIDWDASGWTKNDLYDAIWIWNPGSGNYAAYGSQAGTNGATKDIPVGQSFFVQASNAGAALAMNNNVRIHSSQPFFKDTKEVENLLRIKARANNYSDEIIVRFMEGSTNNFDGQYDAAKMFGLEDAPQLYSMADDDIKLSINSLPFQEEAIEIPIGFQTEFSGDVVFEFTSVDSFDPEVSLYLHDQLTGVITNLRTTPQYAFTHSEENDPLRFKLSFNDATSVYEPDMFNIQAYFYGQMLHLYITEEIRSESQVNIYNASGQAVYSGNVKPGKSSVSVPVLPQGVYMIQVINDKQTVVRKALYN
jgi:hypothetical protein